MDGKTFRNLIDEIENILWSYGDELEWFRIYTPDEGKYSLEMEIKRKENDV